MSIHFPIIFFRYLHRIGRTGRFGATGIAISFIDMDMNTKNGDQKNTMKYIKKRIKQGALRQIQYENGQYLEKLQLEIDKGMCKGQDMFLYLYTISDSLLFFFLN